jgi:cytochrome c
VLAQLDRVPPYSGAQPALDDRPIAWCQAFDGGRSWYTGMGGTAASYADAAFRSHLGGGIAYAAGTEAGDCAATLSSSFDKVQLDRGLQMGEVMELAVLPDERVLYINRGTGGTTGSAQVRIYKPATQDTSVAATIPVDQRFEDGLLGITLDPDFATNHWRRTAWCRSTSRSPSRSTASARRTPTATRSPTSGTSPTTARWTPPGRRRRTPTPSPARTRRS